MASACRFGFFEPSSLGLEFEVQDHRHVGQCGVSEREFRIALDPALWGNKGFTPR
jgi:hypothetical protein